MYTNRIRQWNTRPRRKRPTAQAPMIPVGFVVAPVFLLAQPANWQAQLYEAAYERARQAAAIPVHYRRFFSVWN